MSKTLPTRPLDDDRLSDSLRWYVVLIASGALVIGRFVAEGAAAPDGSSSQIFFRLLAIGEPFSLATVFAFALWVMWKSKEARTLTSGILSSESRQTGARWGLVALVAVTVAIAVVLSYGLMGAFPFSMDEWAVRFQARLFLKGQLVGSPETPIPFLREVARPVFVYPAGDGNDWVSGYLPSYSVLLMPFEAIGYPWLLNVLCNTGSVLTVAHVGRRMWGVSDSRPMIAAVALAASSQFIAAAATTYSMPAHLFVNLLWLAALLGEGRIWLWAGPLAFVALTLHQPVPHALFAAPFLLRFLVERQFARLGWILVWWVAAGSVVIWWSGLMTGRLPTFGADGVLYWPTAAALVVMLLHAVLLFTWSSPLVPLLLIVACRRWNERTKVERDLALGILLTLSFYLCFRLVTQGHGWGWRYGHQALGSVALLAAAGWPRFQAVMGGQTAARSLALSLAVTLAIQLPVRAYVMRKVTLPFARAGAWLRAQPERYLVIPTDSLWYGQDLVRNDANLQPPVLLHGRVLSDDERRVLENEQGSTIRQISVNELLTFGLERIPSPQPR